jgi:hypothetical protein
LRRILKRLPSPALVISVIALVAALSGTAIAGGFITGKKFKKQAIRGPITYVTATQSVNTAALPGAPPGVNITAACPSGFFPTGGGVKSDQPSNISGLFVQYSYPSTPNGWTANVFAGTVGPGAPLNESISVVAACVKSKSSSGPLQAITL